MFPDASVDWDLVEWDPEDTMWEAFAAQREISADSPEDTTTKTGKDKKKKGNSSERQRHEFGS